MTTSQHSRAYCFTLRRRLFSGEHKSTKNLQFIPVLHTNSFLFRHSFICKQKQKNPGSVHREPGTTCSPQSDGLPRGCRKAIHLGARSKVGIYNFTFKNSHIHFFFSFSLIKSFHPFLFPVNAARIPLLIYGGAGSAFNRAAASSEGRERCNSHVTLHSCKKISRILYILKL